MRTKSAVTLAFVVGSILVEPSLARADGHPFVFVDLPLITNHPLVNYTVDPNGMVDINNAGQVVATLSDGTTEGTFLATWDDEAYIWTVADHPTDHDSVAARAISNDGTVVGELQVSATDQPKAFVYSNGTYTIPTTFDSTAWDLNNNSDFVGEVFSGGQPAAYINNVAIQLLGLDGDLPSATCAVGISPGPQGSKLLMGVSSKTGDSFLHAVTWIDPQQNTTQIPVDLTPNPTSDHVAWAANNLDNIVGYGTDGSGVPNLGLLWEAQGNSVWLQRSLPTIVRPWGINVHDEIVGESSSLTEGWLWKEGPSPAFEEHLIALHEAVAVPKRDDLVVPCDGHQHRWGDGRDYRLHT